MVKGCLFEAYGISGFHLGEQRQVDADDIRNAGIASGGLPVGHEDEGCPSPGTCTVPADIPAEIIPALPSLCIITSPDRRYPIRSLCAVTLYSVERKLRNPSISK